MTPTDSELAILQVLWSQPGRAGATVRTVNEALNDPAPPATPPERTIGYTTTLKLLQLMAEKGLVTRDESLRSHVYAAAVSQERTQKTLLRRFVDSTFGGSRSQLILRALGSEETTAEELAAIKQLIARLENDDDHA